ncbi:MAG: glucosidase [Terracidiphilus sp.]|jgi:hypothetical protein
MTQGKEASRLAQNYDPKLPVDWLHWGPYLSERQWGTVREDYSAGGDAWDYFPHDQARSRAYRWGEDGLAGICDDMQKLCFSIALWNGQDPILKERLFGLTNGEGNHGEDVKEYYYYLDNTPTHSYMKWLYKYTQHPYPYASLVQENARRKQTDPHAFEYELIDTGVFADQRYFDVQVEYAKNDVCDILIKIRITNHGPDSAPLHLLPTLLFRNTWSWVVNPVRPTLVGKLSPAPNGVATIQATCTTGTTGLSAVDLEQMMLYCNAPDELLFCENETNTVRLWNTAAATPYPKDGINDYLIAKTNTVNPALNGTKASAAYHLTIASQQTVEVRLRLSADQAMSDPFGAGFDTIFANRISDADEFYANLGPAGLSADRLAIQRQAYAGMLWSKQFYYYIVCDWLKGDPVGPPPPNGRTRNEDWTHLYAANVLTMPDVWEYPWFASWDLCFQTVVFARLDLNFAKQQLLTLAREWYMSPSGAVPAYEWAFGDVNPPLHAWAALKIFAIEQELNGKGDTQFLADIFNYCLMYFTWWSNRKDSDENNLFEGGFLGLDNISIIDRSNLDSLEQQISKQVELYQSDGTSWMGMFCLNMMQMAITLAAAGISEMDRLASKFFQHFVFIADALNSLEQISGGQVKLWSDTDNFYYDALRVSSPGITDQYLSIQLRSLVGIIPLFPVASLDLSVLSGNSQANLLQSHIQWFASEHPELLVHVMTTAGGTPNQLMLTFVQQDRLKQILTRVLDESEFLSPHGIRGLSRVYFQNPYSLQIDSATLTEQYEPAESSNGLFGGNSNWRGPVWFPINFLLIDALRSYHSYLGPAFTVEYPTHSGVQHTLEEVADDLSNRLVSIFERGTDGTRPVFGGNATFQQDPNWHDLLFFYEYFQGDNAAGLGANHQTGWTGLVAELLRAN